MATLSDKLEVQTRIDLTREDLIANGTNVSNLIMLDLIGRVLDLIPEEHDHNEE